MNNKRRKQINSAISLLKQIKHKIESIDDNYDDLDSLEIDEKMDVSEIIEQISEEISTIQDDVDTYMSEEQESYDNLPEALQWSEKGEMMEEAINNLESARDSIETAASDLSTLCEELEDEFVSVECYDIIGSIDEAIEYLESAIE